MVSGPDLKPVVLLFTFCEYGQANVNLALAYELALRDVEVHIASFTPLEKRVAQLQATVSKKCALLGKTSLVDFHLCKGPTHFEALAAIGGIEEHNLPHGPGVAGALKSYTVLEAIMAPMSGETYAESIENCQELIRSVRPNVAVVDSMFRSAIDACTLAKQKFMIMSPNSYKEVAMDAQPGLATFWKYPAISSGFPFPLPWSYLPSNIYLQIRLILTIVTSARIKSLQSHRTAAGLTNHFFQSRLPGVKCLCPALPEIDFPFSIIPPDIISCGPIVFPAELSEAQEKDPQLFEWLEKGPTVLINLGSHAMADEKLAGEFASSLRILLERDPTGKVQVLWKSKAHGSITQVLETILGKEVKAGRVKIVDWLIAEPGAILQHPNVRCTVHHGGANSFYEGVWAGVPHIVLPVWYDTYDFARRAEFLKIGLYGNSTSAPLVSAKEFGDALVRVVLDTSKEAGMFRENAQKLKTKCRERGNGREVACKAVLEAIGM